jgi:hypothetical protein
MAFGSNSKIFRAFLTDVLAANVAHDLNAAGMKVALYNNTPTPDQDVATANSGYNTGQWVTANEVFQAGQWAQGGVALANPTVTNPAAATVMFDADDVSSGSAATLSSVFGALVYNDTPSGDPGICYLSFGGSQSVTAGTFSCIFNAQGIARFTL